MRFRFASLKQKVWMKTSSFFFGPDLNKCVRVEAGREIYFERMMKRGIKGVKEKDQKDKTAISFCTGLLLLTRPRHSAG